MPNIDITLPQTTREVRARLAERLTDEFARTTGFEREILGISFREYSPGTAAEGGKLIEDVSSGGPVHVQISCPRVTRAKKRAAVEALTAVFKEVAGWPSPPVFHISEHPYDNVGVGGRLLSDAFPELKEIPFYFPTDDPA